jgi:hypothetical protein
MFFQKPTSQSQKFQKNELLLFHQETIPSKSTISGAFQEIGIAFIEIFLLLLFLFPSSHFQFQIFISLYISPVCQLSEITLK